MDLPQLESLFSSLKTNTMEEMVKKRLEKMNLAHDPNDWKLQQEDIYAKKQKDKRQELLKLARETKMEVMEESDQEESKEDLTANEEIKRYPVNIGLFDYMVTIPKDLVLNW